MHFEIGHDDFDLGLLPSGAREAGTPAYDAAVTAYFQDEFAGLDGDVSVDIGPSSVRVTWGGTGSRQGLYDQSVDCLARGDLLGAVALLRALTAVEPGNAAAHYNLGMALSDTGRYQDAILHLLKVTYLDATNGNALVALGVALWRNGDPDGAQRRLEQAISLDYDNGYAHRNLAAILEQTGRSEEAIAYYRDAYRVLPQDQPTVYGLAHALDTYRNEAYQSEADELYTAAIALNPSSPIAELAKTARGQIAQRFMRKASGGIRMDAVMYCLGALEQFATMSPGQVQQVALEIAVTGQRGIEVNDSSVIYHLRALPGDFTGLQLMSYMFVAFRQVAPDADIDFDLSQEYTSALELFEQKSGR